MSFQQQQQFNSQQQRQRNRPDDLRKQLQTRSRPNTQHHKSPRNETGQEASLQPNRQGSVGDEEQSFAMIERRVLGKPAESPVDTAMSYSFPTYVYRPRGSSNSSQTTVTTSLGKLSLNEGNNNCQSESAVAVSEETAPRDGVLTVNGHCKQSKLDPVVIKDRKTKIYDVTSKYMEGKNSIKSQERRKIKCDSNYVEPPSIAVITNRFKCTPGASTIGVLAKKLRSLPLHGNTKSVATPQQKSEQRHENEDTRRISTDSAKSTISNSSLQDLDDTEFIGSELAHYMGQLNEQKLVH
jgi:hypothetical protein